MIDDMARTRAIALRTAVLCAESVTVAMTDWCETHGIGRTPLVSHVHLRADAVDLPADTEVHLRASEPVFFRRITLMAGAVPLLDADNWFLPTRLPDRVVELLLSTDTPFGSALGSGRQTRKTTCVLVPTGAGDLGCGAIERDDVPLLTLRGVAELEGRAVSFVEERFRLDVLG